jgi:4-carboxymuconolactone decarboxylase
MARLDRPSREDLGSGGQGAWDHVMGSRGHIGGPFTVLVHSPELCKRVSDVGAYARFESSLDKGLRTIAVMMTARAFNCRFEWAGWTKQAREADVPEAIIEAIRERRKPDNLTPDQALVMEFGRQILGAAHRVDPETYNAALGRFGLQGTIDLAMTFGYFAMLTFTLNTFEVDVPEGHDVLPTD